MIRFPNCKINIGLEIIRKRDDGYHDISTVFYPIKSFHDSLEIHKSDSIKLVTYGIELNIPIEKNIVFKAYELLRTTYDLPPIAIHLLKYVPHGAGLGGGSSDAAAMLCLLNAYFKLDLSQQQLIQYAAQLGSDCAFFILNAPSYAEGRGEKLQPISIDLSGLHIALIKPDVYISTALAFANVKPRNSESLLQNNIIQFPIQEWRNYIYNDFEASIFPAFPDLANIKQQLYNHGAVYAAMSGSGSTLYGLFKHPIKASDIQFTDCTTYVFKL